LASSAFPAKVWEQFQFVISLSDLVFEIATHRFCSREIFYL
jgi:hypothetical protein